MSAKAPRRPIKNDPDFKVFDEESEKKWVKRAAKPVVLSKLKIKKILNETGFSKTDMGNDFDELSTKVMQIQYDPEYKFKKLKFYIPITDRQYSKSFRLEQQIKDMVITDQAPFNLWVKNISYNKECRRP